MANHGGGAVSGIYFEAGTLELEDVEFVGNFAGEYYGAILGTGQFRLHNVLFEGNYSNCCYAGAHLTGSGELENVRFIYNESGDGTSTLYLNGDFEARNILFDGNRIYGFGYDGDGVIDLHGGSIQLTNIVFLHGVNPAEQAGLISTGATVSITNATIASSFGPAIWINPGGIVTVRNSVVWGNRVYPWVDYEVPPGTVSYENCIVERSGGSGLTWNDSFGTDLGGNLDADPRFIDTSGSEPGDGNYHLLPGSPAIDSGDDAAIPAGLLTDLDGNARITGRSVDMGAYEYPCEIFDVAFGQSWDGVSLQEILDAEYGPGTIDAATEYEGYLCGDASQPYWLDSSVDGWLVREIAGFASSNVMGWHVEDFTQPVIDGVDDGIIFSGTQGPGAITSITLPAGETRFGFYMNPNGSGSTPNAPEPEHFFANRHYNDAGPMGPGTGDPQCLIYNVSELRGMPAYVLAWEDIDYGSGVTPQYEPRSTDNDFQDMVVEIRATSPVPVLTIELAATARESGVELRWDVAAETAIDALTIQRATRHGSWQAAMQWNEQQIPPEAEWTDRPTAGTWRYRAVAEVSGVEIASRETTVSLGAPSVNRVGLLSVAPNPFNPSTTIRFQTDEPGPVVLSIYDVAGRHVRRLVDEALPANMHQVQWLGQDDSGSSVSSGVYLIRLEASGHIDQMRAVLLK